jgi:hypothetical protein
MRPEDARKPKELRWEKSKHAFERIVEDGQRAAGTLMRTLDELGQRTKARVEKARIQRARFRRSAELGSRIYELSRVQMGAESSEAGPDLLGDETVKALLLDISKLDEALSNTGARLGNGAEAFPNA